MRHLPTVVGLVLCALTTRSVEASPVFNPTNGHYYQVVQASGITWADAMTAATSLGGYLATSTSAAENAFINALRVAGGAGQIWLGGFQPPGSAEPAGGWEWVNGEGALAAGFTNWNGAEPNNLGGAENHLAIGLFDDATWNDESNLGNIWGFIVEWDADPTPVPEPASLALFGLSALGLGALRRRRRS